MIPTMDDILAQLAAGSMDMDTAKMWINQHFNMAVDAAAMRQYFAGEAMNAILSRADGRQAPSDVAESAISIADAMVEAFTSKKG